MTITFRNRLLIVASGCIALSLLIFLREFISKRNLTIFEVPLMVSAANLFAWAAWAADARMDRTWTRWLSITGTVVSLLVLAMLLAFPNGDPMLRIIVTAAVTLSLAGAVLKAGSS